MRTECVCVSFMYARNQAFASGLTSLLHPYLPLMIHANLSVHKLYQEDLVLWRMLSPMPVSLKCCALDWQSIQLHHIVTGSHTVPK